MKIGILTLPLHTNYGGILQAYALYQTLESLGHKPYFFIIDRSNFLGINKLLKKGVNALLHIFDSRYVSISQCCRISMQKIDYFIEKNICNVIPLDVFHESLKSEQIRDKIDAIIVGSDQIWRPEYSKDVRLYYLKFAKEWNIKKIAYAASFGGNKWNYSKELSKECSCLLKDFNGVSVRESDAIDLCKTNFDVTPKLVLDPTFLLKTNQYYDICKDYIKNEHVVLSYLLDEDNFKNEVLKEVCKLKKLEVKSNLKKQYCGHDIRKIVPLWGVDEWLANFYSSDFVVTDSYHGCVFSIIFNKPFIVILNELRGISRFKTILNIFGLENRIIKRLEDVEGISSTPIDWNSVNRKRNELVESSILFLSESLK